MCYQPPKQKKSLKKSITISISITININNYNNNCNCPLSTWRTSRYLNSSPYLSGSAQPTMESPNFDLLYSRPCSFGHWPQLVTIGEGLHCRLTSESEDLPCGSATSFPQNGPTVQYNVPHGDPQTSSFSPCLCTCDMHGLNDDVWGSPWSWC